MRRRKIAAFPGEQWAEGHREQKRDHHGPNVVEERCANGKSCRRSPPAAADKAVPISTVAAAVKNRLLNTSASSREIGWKMPPAVRLCN